MFDCLLRVQKVRAQRPLFSEPWEYDSEFKSITQYQRCGQYSHYYLLVQSLNTGLMQSKETKDVYWGSTSTYSILLFTIGTYTQVIHMYVFTG